MNVYIDMDDTICDFKKAARKRSQLQFPQSKIGFFEQLEPFDGAIEVVNYLRTVDILDVYILTAPSVLNPHSYSEKRIWIENHFDLKFCEKLIISSKKGLLKGDILIDDYASGKGQEFFEGKLLHFGSDEFKNWFDIKRYFLKNFSIEK